MSRDPNLRPFQTLHKVLFEELRDNADGEMSVLISCVRYMSYEDILTNGE